MKKQLIFFVASLSMFARPAMAELGPIEQLRTNATTVDSAEFDYFKELSTWFEKGTEVSFDDVKDGWTGRCFDKIAPSIPYNNFLASYEDTLVGPGFPSRKYLLPAERTDKPANYYDGYDFESDPDNLKPFIQSKISEKLFQQTSEENGTLSWAFKFNSDRPLAMRYSIRRYQNFFVARGENLINNSAIYSISAGRVVKDIKIGTWTMCYYFRK